MVRGIILGTSSQYDTKKTTRKYHNESYHSFHDSTHIAQHPSRTLENIQNMLMLGVDRRCNECYAIIENKKPEYLRMQTPATGRPYSSV